jgi:hypothetical protein
MEPSGCNRWQRVANAATSKTAQIAPGQHFRQHSGRLLAVAAFAASPVIGLVWPFRLLGDLHCPQSVRLCKPEVTGSIPVRSTLLEVRCG